MSRLRIFSALMACLLLLAALTACGDSAATTAPTTTAAATTAAAKPTTAASGATTAAATTAASTGATTDDPALVDAAKKEGKFVWYTVWFNQDIVNEIGAKFMEKYPGIKVEGTRNVAATIYQKLTQEMQAGIKNVDVFGTTDIGQIVELKTQSKLMNYTPAGKESVIEAYRNLDPDNAYQTGALIPLVIGYNSTKIKADELPKTWQDLTSDKYKDKISTGSGAASGQVGTWALTMQQKYTWDTYFNAFNKNNPKLGRSINDAVNDLISGERALGIVPLGQILFQKNKGNPVDVVYPSDGTVVVASPAGILKDAPHPNAAKLFMNFLNSKEYADVVAKYYEQPIRGDVAVNGAKSLKDIQNVSPTPDQIVKDLPDIIKKWKTLFGA